MQELKKEKNFWVSLDIEDFKKINDLAESKNIPLKEFAGGILKKNLVDKNEIAVVLKIPKDKVNSAENLEEWLNQQKKALIGLLNKKNN